jgi:hypothetical protein
MIRCKDVCRLERVQVLDTLADNSGRRTAIRIPAILPAMFSSLSVHLDLRGAIRRDCLLTHTQ